jgi:hypothetical protein
MNKKLWLGFIAVFGMFEVMNFIVNGLLLMSSFDSLKNLWRPDMMSLMWIFHVNMLIGAFFFILVFSKGYEGKGIVEGVRYGLYIGIWMGVGFAYGTYAMIAIPYTMALIWFVTALMQYILAGIIAAAIFDKDAMVTAVARGETISPPAPIDRIDGSTGR